MSDDSYVNVRRFEAANFELMYWQERLEAARHDRRLEPFSRDELAASAMQGILSAGQPFPSYEALARESYCLADAMIAAREVM